MAQCSPTLIALAFLVFRVSMVHHLIMAEKKEREVAMLGLNMGVEEMVVEAEEVLRGEGVRGGEGGVPDVLEADDEIRLGSGGVVESAALGIVEEGDHLIL